MENLEQRWGEKVSTETYYKKKADFLSNMRKKIGRFLLSVWHDLLNLTVCKFLLQRFDDVSE